MKHIVMIGSDREVRGGVSAMVNVCFGHGLFDRWEARYLPTHCDGGWGRKAARAGASLARFAAALAARRVALVHAHIASGASFWRKLVFLAAARAAGVPYILHVHAGDFDGFLARSSARTRALLRWLYAGAHAVIALSPSWRPAIQAAVPQARVEVVPNPVDIPPYCPRTAAAVPTAVFLGVVRPEKGVYELLEAWPRVLQSMPQALLVIAGTGELEQARARARELGIAAHVEFPGWLGPQEKARLLARATALVLPSHFEALPMAVLEGMAAGLPVVATSVGAIPEAVGPDAGILVEPRDVTGLARAIVATIGNERRRAAMGAAARQRARAAYSADVVVPAIERLWEELAPEAKRTSAAAGSCP